MLLRGTRFKRIVSGTVCLLILGLMVIAWDIYRFAQVDATSHADAAIVLGAAAFGDDPSPVLRERVNHAIQLYETGMVSSLIMTGGQGATGNASEARVAANFAIANGIPGAAILLDECSRDTVANLRHARQIGVEAGFTTYLVVSTPYHMRRVTLIAADLDLDVKSSPTRTIAWISWYTQSRAFVQEMVRYALYLLDKQFS